jgi:septal ring factor EnvC (AmiA/AmiB activator)
LTASTKSVLAASLYETKAHEATLRQLETSFTETTKQIDEFISTHDSSNTLLEKLTSLEQKLRTIENAKSYIKALLVASELRYGDKAEEYKLTKGNSLVTKI